MKINISELRERVEQASALASKCGLCPRNCGVDRAAGEAGFCNARYTPKIYSYRKFMGEEPPISGKNGSGVIFFSHCAMRCAYCQNYRFSQLGEGYDLPPEKLGKVMSGLLRDGCHNINLVTASHYLPAVLESLLIAAAEIPKITVVYNTSGYESQQALRILDGIVDIYLADMRYSDSALSKAYSAAADYVQVNRAAIKTMRKQVGGLVTNSNGAGKSGLIIRHLILPGQLANTDGALRYIARDLSTDTHVSLMSQYLPLYTAGLHPEIDRTISAEEYRAARDMLHAYGLVNGWTQEL